MQLESFDESVWEFMVRGNEGCVLCVVMKKNESWEERNSEGGFMDRGGGTDSNFLPESQGT